MSKLCKGIETVFLPPDLFGEGPDTRSIATMREFEPRDGYWLAFSGGKDSVVLLDLAKRAGVRFEAHYSLTTIDPPELVQFIKRECKEVVIDKPEHSFLWHIRNNRGLPMRQGRWCCSELKERGGIGRRVLTGIRSDESASRSKRAVVSPCRRPGSNGKIMVSPMLHWTTDQVWQYIHARSVPYCSLYDEGWHRLGCVFCPFERNIERAISRWPKMFTALRNAVAYAYPTQERWKKFGSPEAVLEWWLDRDRPQIKSDEQFAFDQFGDELYADGD